MAILKNPSRSERLRVSRRQLQLRLKLEPRLRRQMHQELRATGHMAVMAVMRGRSIEPAMSTHRQHVQELIARHYNRVGEAFAKEYTSDLPKAWRGHETKDSTNVFSSNFAAWVSKWAADKAESIAATTRKDVRQAIIDGEAEGENIDQIASRIRSATGGLLGRSRAVTIARTEVHAAASFTNDTIGTSLGLGTRVNIWAGVGDDRERESHLAVEGQEWPEGDTIHVGNSDLLYPGDPNGEAEDVIQCRCNALHRYPDAEAFLGSADELLNEDNAE